MFLYALFWLYLQKFKRLWYDTSYYTTESENGSLDVKHCIWELGMQAHNQYIMYTKIPLSSSRYFKTLKFAKIRCFQHTFVLKYTSLTGDGI